MAEPNSEFLILAQKVADANQAQDIGSKKLSCAIAGIGYQIQRLNVYIAQRPVAEDKIPYLEILVGCLEDYSRRILAAASSFNNLQEKVGRELDEENIDFNNTHDPL